MIRKFYKDEPRIKVESYDCLTIDFAHQVDAQFIVRGIRTVKDFEYEETIADINRKLAGIETILLFTEPELTCVSSTIVRELLGYNKDISMFIPKGMGNVINPCDHEKNNIPAYRFVFRFGTTGTELWLTRHAKITTGRVRHL